MQEIRAVPALPARRADAHKGDFGRVLIVGGSVGTTGAAILAARGALRSGAGLVDVAVPRSAWVAVAGAVPSALVSPLDEDASGGLKPGADQLQLRLDASTSAVVGPGMGTQAGAVAALTHILGASHAPLALDADALNILAAKANLRADLRPGTVLTPHPGEMARLAGLSRDAVQSDRLGVASRFAALHRVIVVLKGAGTIVTDGERSFVNTTGSHSLARGGTGDVLAGVLGALLAQKMPPFDAAILAVHAHGLAGDLASERLGPRGMTTEDVAETLPAAWKRLESR